MAYNLINASLRVLLLKVSQIWLWRSWKTKDFYNTTDENLDKSQLIGGISKPAATFWCLRTFFFPLKAVLVGINQGRPREWVIYSGQHPAWEAASAGCKTFHRGDFSGKAVEGESEEVNWLEWNLCRGGAGHGAGPGLHENRNQGSDLLLGVGAWTRNNLQAWRKYSTAASSWSVCRQHIQHCKTVGSLICIFFFYLCDFLECLMFMSSDIWVSEL